LTGEDRRATESRRPDAVARRDQIGLMLIKSRSFGNGNVVLYHEPLA
jgi:hypothetical protein